MCWAWSQERTPVAPVAAAITHPAHMPKKVSAAPSSPRGLVEPIPIQPAIDAIPAGADIVLSANGLSSTGRRNAVWSATAPDLGAASRRARTGTRLCGASTSAGMQRCRGPVPSVRPTAHTPAVGDAQRSTLRRYSVSQLVEPDAEGGRGAGLIIGGVNGRGGRVGAGTEQQDQEQRRQRAADPPRRCYGTAGPGATVAGPPARSAVGRRGGGRRAQSPASVAVAPADRRRSS
jgi:hypothetical protein